MPYSGYSALHRVNPNEKKCSWILLQNCSLFEEEQVAIHLRSHLDKFSVLYEKTLQSKKQQTKIDISLQRWVTFF